MTNTYIGGTHIRAVWNLNIKDARFPFEKIYFLFFFLIDRVSKQTDKKRLLLKVKGIQDIYY